MLKLLNLGTNLNDGQLTRNIEDTVLVNIHHNNSWAGSTRYTTICVVVVGEGLEMKIGLKNPLLLWKGHPLCRLNDLDDFTDVHTCLEN